MSHPSMPFSGRGIEYQDIPVKNGVAFWPDLNLKEFQEQRALPPYMSSSTMLIALLSSVKEVNDALGDVVRTHSAAGHVTASVVPGASAGDENELTAQYKKAVYARAKADLMGEFQTIGRRDTIPGQEGSDTRESLLAEASLVLRNMQGYGRVGIYHV